MKLNRSQNRNERDSAAERKLRRVLCGCSRCPPHDGENRGRRPKSDRGKNKRRAS